MKMARLGFYWFALHQYRPLTGWLRSTPTLYHSALHCLYPIDDCSYLFIIRKTKRFAIPERAVYFLKTKRTAGVLPHPKNFRPAYAGIHIMQERSPDTIRTPFFSFCRFAPAFRASRYAASLNALYATTLCALTSLPRKARHEPTYAYAFDASLLAFAFDTPPNALA